MRAFTVIMYNIFVVHSGKFVQIPESDAYEVTYINETTTKGKKQAYKVKGHFAARQTPFIGVYDEDNKGIKGFYSEDSFNVFEDFKEWFNSNK